MSTDRDRALAKIQKLLRLAKDGRGNATEAETALRQAQSLMAKFNIDDAEATTKDLQSNPDAIIKAWCKAGYHAKAVMITIPKWANIISWAVAKLYECRLAYVKGGDVGALGIVFGGYHVDVQVASWTFEYLMECVRRASDNFEEALLKGDSKALAEMGITPMQAMRLLTQPSKGRKSDFRFGMAAELQRRLLALAAERAGAQKASVAGSALVVAKGAALDAHFGKERPAKPMGKKAGAGAVAGRAHGQRTRLEPNPLSSGPRAAAPALLEG